MPKLFTRPGVRSAVQRGVSMLETMVACLVLSAGLITISAMQTRAVFNSSDAALQGYAAQILLSFSEAKLVEPNISSNVGGWTSGCNGRYSSTATSDQALFVQLLQTLCPTSTVVDFFPKSQQRDCNIPYQSSVNVYCKSSRVEIDFRQPIWAH